MLIILKLVLKIFYGFSINIRSACIIISDALRERHEQKSQKADEHQSKTTHIERRKLEELELRKSIKEHSKEHLEQNLLGGDKSIEVSNERPPSRETMSKSNPPVKSNLQRSPPTQQNPVNELHTDSVTTETNRNVTVQDSVTNKKASRLCIVL